MIPLTNLETIYKNIEFSPDVLISCINTLCSLPEIDETWVAEFFETIKKTCRFSITVKFLTKIEKVKLQTLFTKIGKDSLSDDYKLHT